MDRTAVSDGWNLDKRDFLITVTGAILFAVVLFRTAWICDDAYIAFRTIDNFIHGFGLTWNVDERVQSFTNPLWTLFLSIFYFFTREIYLTSIFLSITISLAAFWVLATRMSDKLLVKLGAMLCLIFSSSYVDYSTSGLENPMTHLLLGFFYTQYLRENESSSKLFRLTLIASLGLVNRIDLMFLFLVPLAYSAFKTPCRIFEKVRCISLALLPIILWEFFSIIYYGFPFPNTAYAKMTVGFSFSQMAAQGFFYLLDSLDQDPLVIVVVLLSLASVFFLPSRKRAAAAAGIVLQIFYIVRVGGDFMSGRFLTGVYFAAVCLFVDVQNSIPQACVGFAFVALPLILGFAVPIPTLLSDKDYAKKKSAFGAAIQDNQIANERAFYFQDTGLINQIRGINMPKHPWMETFRTQSSREPKVKVHHVVGMAGYGAGPGIHILDRFALGDPLLARLPMESDRIWRIGHYNRAIPYGYVKSLETNENYIVEPHLKEFYGYLRKVIRGRIFSLERFWIILKMNFGLYKHLIHDYENGFIKVKLKEVDQPKAKGTLWDAKGNFILPRAGMRIDLEKIEYAPAIEVSWDGNDWYLVTYLLRGVNVGEQVVEPYSTVGLMVRNLSVPAEAIMKGYDAIRIRPTSDDEQSSLGHLRLILPEG